MKPLCTTQQRPHSVSWLTAMVWLMATQLSVSLAVSSSSSSSSSSTSLPPSTPPLPCLSSLPSTTTTCTPSDSQTHHVALYSSSLQQSKQKQRRQQSKEQSKEEEPPQHQHQAAASLIVETTSVMYGLQQLGVSTLVATVLVAAVQASIALIQYRQNPNGFLVVPPGPTVGQAEPRDASVPTLSRDCSKEDDSQPFWWGRNGGEKDNNDNDKDDNEPEEDVATATALTQTRFPALPQPSTTFLGRVNRFLFLLLPWFASNVHYVLTRQGHLFHIAIVISLVKFLDKGRQRLVRFWDRSRQRYYQLHQLKSNDNDNQLLHQNVLTEPTEKHLAAATNATQMVPSKPIERVLVLGDSLAVGIGSVEEFENERTKPENLTQADFWRIENVPSTANENFTDITANTSTAPIASSLFPNRQSVHSPVFPQALAQSLAAKSGSPVSWRSAGVDGGDIPHIRELLLPVLQQEVDNGRPPDCVVLLCGMNDLKYQFSRSLSQPWKLLSARTFRQDLRQLLHDICRICPAHTRILLPAMPVQMFLKNTVVSIFPLVLILDVIVGYWEYQKKQMVREFGGHAASRPRRVEYLPMSTAVLKEWYERDEQERQQPKNYHGHKEFQAQHGFVAADGIHPNAKCYSYWAEHVANALTRQR